MLRRSLIIAVDFDGTITEERDMGKIMTLQKNCKETLSKWYSEGHRLILWTCRAGKAYEDALEFLERNDMTHLFSAFNDQLPEINDKYYPNVAKKVGADVYVDDRNIGITRVDWEVFDRAIEDLAMSISGII